MPQPRLSNDRLLGIYQAVKDHGSIALASDALREPYNTVGKVYREARRILQLPEVRRDPRAVTMANAIAARTARAMEFEDEAPNDLALEVPITDGVVVAFGDAHWRSLKQSRSLAHEGLLNLLRHLKPTHLFAMGDMMDLAAIGRHGTVMWEDRPTVMDEIGAAQTHLAEIRERAGDPDCIWIRGNHDDRFEKFLSNNAAAFAEMPGARLEDHFSEWDLAWRVDVPGVLVAMHGWHNGIHAAHNNVVKAGLSTITGHTHQLVVRPHQDFTGRRWGIETGTLADPNWPQFAYCLGATQKAAPGFAVLTIRGGRLLQPETAEVVDGVCWFRGEPLAGRWRTRRTAGREQTAA